MQSDNARIVTEEHNSLQASEAEAIHEQCFLPRPAKPRARLTQYTTNASQYTRMFCSSPGAELEGSRSIFSCLAFFLLSSGEERDEKNGSVGGKRLNHPMPSHRALYDDISPPAGGYSKFRNRPQFRLATSDGCGMVWDTAPDRGPGGSPVREETCLSALRFN
jgi:hypothetical protein